MKIAVIITMLLIATSAHAGIGIGYTMNLPGEWAGMGIFVLRDGLGAFFMSSTDLQRKDTMDISSGKISSWGDTQTQSIKSYGGAMYGVTYKLDDGVYAYLGLGSRAEQRYYQYYDRYEILGDNGKYWVKGGNTLERRYAGGLVLLQNRLMWVVGASAKPIRLSAGVGGVF